MSSSGINVNSINKQRPNKGTVTKTPDIRIYDVALSTEEIAALAQ